MTETPHYLPAMGHDSLLPLYDPFTRLVGVRWIHRNLIDDAAISAGQHVLEIGCGTGNLALEIARQRPDVSVIGLDPDPLALARARRKADRAGRAVQWDRGTAARLPYPDRSLDRVVSSLMFHHLGDDEKRLALAEVVRVLRPGGRLHLVDFGGHRHGLFTHLARHNRRVHANDGDAIPDRMRAAGMVDVAEIPRRSRLGTTYYRGSRSD